MVTTYATNATRRGMGSIIGVCLAEKSKDPIVIIKKLMALPFFIII